MDCQTCKERNTQAEPIPYIAYESAMARMERANKRTWIALIIAIVLLVGSNIGWIVYENQFQEVVTTQDVWQKADGDGSNRFIGGDYYGNAESADND